MLKCVENIVLTFVGIVLSVVSGLILLVLPTSRGARTCGLLKDSETSSDV